MLVVRAASELDIGWRRLTAGRMRHHVVKLEKAVFGASPLRAYERTSPLVTSPDLTADRRRNPARSLGSASWRSSSGRDRQLGALEVLEQQCQRTIEDNGHVTVRNAVPHQILHTPQLVEGLDGRRELHFIACGREWTDDCRAV